MTEVAVRTLDEISDEELESCIDGSTDLDMVRRLLVKCQTVDGGWVDECDFADLFAYEIEGFIDAERGSPEFRLAWDTNNEWGLRIAEFVNEVLGDT
jgi:hypothetical protein